MTTLDWNIVTAIAELVGAVAVVVTLVYLLIRIGQNTTAVLDKKEHTPWQYQPLADL